MSGLLLLVFIVVPILEIIVFIRAGEWIGLWPTVAGVVLTAVIGAAIVRHQGLSTLARAQKSVGEGRFPVTEVFDGLCLVFAGAFLITPGFLTDSVGFLLLVPPVRAFLRRIVGNRMIASGRVKVWAEAPPRDSPSRGKRDGIVIDAEYEHVPDEPEKPQAPGESEEPQAPGKGLHKPQAPDLQAPDPQACGESPEADRGAGSPWRKGGGKGGDRNAGDR